MKKVIIFLVLVIIIGLIISGIVYLNIEENKRIDAEAVILNDDLSIGFGEDVKVSDFVKSLKGEFVNDYKIDTEKLGKVKVSFNYRNAKNKERTEEFYINVLDVTAPKILSSSSFTVKVGYNKDLTEVLLSGDDIDDNPVREIKGDYDFNTAGKYNLTYVVTDASGNKSEKDFTLNVVEKSSGSSSNSDSKKIHMDEVIEKYKTDNNKIGIDVSKWQEDIDWKKVKAAGVEFVMLRMGYQKGYDEEYEIDPYFDKNIKEAKKVGLPVGVYFYSYAKSVDEAKEQAKWVKKNLKKYKIDLPVAFDWESWNSFNTTGMSFYTLNKAANEFLDILAEAGYKGMLYSSKTYLENIWYPTKYETWLAHYAEKTTYEGEYSMWQMCDTGRVDGVKGNVDIDIMERTF